MMPTSCHCNQTRFAHHSILPASCHAKQKEFANQTVFIHITYEINPNHQSNTSNSYKKIGDPITKYFLHLPVRSPENASVESWIQARSKGFPDV
jgi:hypothetical protein